MTKLYYDEVSINREVLPNLNSAINSITKANSVTFVIPSGFGYSSYLANLFSDNLKTKKRINNVKTMLDRSKRNYKSAKNNNMRMVKTIQNYKLSVDKGFFGTGQ